MRVAVAAASIAAALAAATPAVAKEPVRATFCGASGCRTFEDRATLNMVPGGEATTPLGPAAPYYRVEIVNREGPRGPEYSFFEYYVPSANAMAWEEPESVMRFHPIFGAATNDLMRRLVRGLEPFPRPTVTRVDVGGRRVSGDAAQSSLDLFDPFPRSSVAESPDDWISIDLRSSRPSPWTDVGTDLVYSPSANALERGWTRVKVTAALAEDVEAGRVLDGSQARSWRLAFAAVPLGLVGLAVLALRGRKRTI